MHATRTPPPQVASTFVLTPCHLFVCRRGAGIIAERARNLQQGGSSDHALVLTGAGRTLRASRAPLLPCSHQCTLLCDHRFLPVRSSAPPHPTPHTAPTSRALAHETRAEVKKTAGNAVREFQRAPKSLQTVMGSVQQRINDARLRARLEVRAGWGALAGWRTAPIVHATRVACVRGGLGGGVGRGSLDARICSPPSLTHTRLAAAVNPATALTNPSNLPTSTTCVV